ncbi:uncharacterized protein [Rutidosis leptorrhynchoides]|uniref:uncharacterized protein n=1 Tax=Rutidosis leptorrhynchoides TaxID=125765 RepID=UPI003A993671
METEGDPPVYGEALPYEFDNFFDFETNPTNNFNSTVVREKVVNVQDDDFIDDFESNPTNIINPTEEREIVVNVEADDLMVDEDNIIGEYHVDMTEFNYGEDFDSADEYDDSFEGIRKRKYRELKEQEKAKGVSKTNFYVGEIFASAYEVKEYVKLHAIENRRNLVFTKNDLTRVTVGCEGLIVKVLTGEVIGGRSSQVLDKTKKKRTCKETRCVKTLDEEHMCLGTREIHHCTYNFLSTKLVDQLPSNPKMPTKALRYQLESSLGLEVPTTKAYKALKKALETMRGSYKSQYADIRSYGLELIRCNPGTTVKILTEPCDPDETTRVFKRIYICLGPLKQGFNAMGRDLLGMDGAHMKPPATGHILTAVGLEPNNSIYPVAYAIVEQENYNSWSWFLECLGDDLGLTRQSNFTFISDRQNGLLQAVARMYPCAEHRFCLRHLHENMKTKGFRGAAYKQLLWKCANATTVPYFEKAMLELKGFNVAAHTYLGKIPPSCWAKSHFSGRAKSDVLLNNMCEVLNQWLLDARDKLIITALEYVREYLMKRIVTGINKVAKCNGPLTPSATKLFESIKKDAHLCRVLWSGSNLYQVNGLHGEQCVVDIGERRCACRKWEITGIPCKHVVACFWNMATNSQDVGPLERWFDPIYYLDTWNRAYGFTINPLNDRSL